MNYSESKGDCSRRLWVPGVEEKVAFLRNPRSYDASARRVEVRETHMSWVFLTDGVVFKLKKPVRFAYLASGARSSAAVAFPLLSLLSGHAAGAAVDRTFAGAQAAHA